MNAKVLFLPERLTHSKAGDDSTPRERDREREREREGEREGTQKQTPRENIQRELTSQERVKKDVLECRFGVDQSGAHWVSRLLEYSWLWCLPSMMEITVPQMGLPQSCLLSER